MNYLSEIKIKLFIFKNRNERDVLKIYDQTASLTHYLRIISSVSLSKSADLVKVMINFGLTAFFSPL